MNIISWSRMDLTYTLQIQFCQSVRDHFESDMISNDWYLISLQKLFVKLNPCMAKARIFKSLEDGFENGAWWFGSHWVAMPKFYFHEFWHSWTKAGQTIRERRLSLCGPSQYEPVLHHQKFIYGGCRVLYHNSLFNTIPPMCSEGG